MKGYDVIDGRTRVSNPKPSPSTLLLGTTKQYENAGREVANSKFSEPLTRDAVFNGEKWVDSLLMLEDKLGTTKRYENAGREAASSKFSEPPTRDAVFNGEKWVDSLLMLEDKRGRK